MMNDTFLGRETELRALEDAYRRDGFQMAVVYGRRRIGKTTLLREFCKDKKAVFFTAIKTTVPRNTELFARAALEELAPELSSSVFPSLDDLCAFLGEKCRDERIVVVIDEFPYYEKKSGVISSTLQKAIDEQWQFGNMFFIVCGSSISFMEDEVLSQKSPLFGRRTMQLRLEALDYRQVAAFLPSWSRQDQAVVYGVTGGVPKYLTLFDENRSLDENLIGLYFSKTGYLYEEADNLLSQEFRDVDVYGRIIEAVASGAGQLTEISDKSGISAQNVTHILNNLLETNIVTRLRAITEETNKKKTRYILSDDMLRFWYRFVPEAVGAIEIGRGDVFYERNVKPYLHEFMGGVFEKMCRYYTLLHGLAGDYLCAVTRVGTWWGANPVKKEETDIDVVGLDKRGREAVIGECKFKTELTDKKVYDTLAERSNLLHEHYRVVQYLLFSASEFSDWLREEAKKSERIRLIRLEDMYDG